MSATAKKEYPMYTSLGYDKIQGKKTGVFHTEKIDNTWWVVDPSGKAFYIIGTDHCNYFGHQCEKLGYAPYHKFCVEKYGSEEKWAETAVQRLLDWNFNSLGANNTPSYPARHRGLAHTEFVGFGVNFAKIDSICPQTGWTGFPNVFNPTFRQFCEQQSEKRCAPHKTDPWLIGYFIDNELEWYGKSGSNIGLFIETIKLAANHTAKLALKEFLQTRYSDITKLNQSWNTKFLAFDEILNLQQMPELNSGINSDAKDWVRLIAEKYFAITTESIRKSDPNHMLLGCRFAGNHPGIMDIAGKYFDIVSINCYRSVDLDKERVSDGFEDELEKWYRDAQKPFMITEWSYPAYDSGLPCKHGAGQRVQTQHQRAQAFTIFQKLLFSNPFIVGSNFFMWVDEPALGIAKIFPEDSNYGLVNEHDEPYQLLTETATRLNAQVYQIHSGQIPEIEVKSDDNQPETFIITNSGKASTSCEYTLWIDGVPETKQIMLEPTKPVIVKPQSIPKPDGHFIVCSADPQKKVLEINKQNNTATTFIFEDKSAKTPVILVGNPYNRLLQNIPLILNQPKFNSAKFVAKSSQKVLKKQVDSDGITILIPELKPYSCETILVYPGVEGKLIPPLSAAAVSCKSLGQTKFEIDTGKLKLIKSADNGHSFDRIEFSSKPFGLETQGKEIGYFMPLLWQYVTYNSWLAPDKIESVEVQSGEIRLVLDVTSSCSSQPHSYKTKYRFVFYPDTNWFTSQLLWLENIDTNPWKLVSYFHFAVSNIAGDCKDDEPLQSYWFDKGNKIIYGVYTPSPVFRSNYWKDADGGEHPDVQREVNVTLAPGERYAEPQPAVYVIISEFELGTNILQELISEVSAKVEYKLYGNSD